MADKTIGEMIVDKKAQARSNALLACDDAYNSDLVVVRVQGIRNGLRAADITRAARVASSWEDQQAKKDLEAQFAPMDTSVVKATPQIPAEMITRLADLLGTMESTNAE